MRTRKLSAALAASALAAGIVTLAGAPATAGSSTVSGPTCWATFSNGTNWANTTVTSGSCHVNWNQPVRAGRVSNGVVVWTSWDLDGDMAPGQNFPLDRSQHQYKNVGVTYTRTVYK